MKLITPLLALAALILSACSNTPVTDTYKSVPLHLKPGEDKTLCTFVTGTNDTEQDIARITAKTKNAHHVILYALPHAVDFPPTECTQGGDASWDTLLVASLADSSVEFPAGVGLHIQPHQQYAIETHYINTEANPTDVQAEVTVEYAPADTVKDHVATYYFGTMNIDVPPHAVQTDKGVCSPPVPMNIHTMLGHQHRFGTSLSVDFVPSDGSASTPLYTSTQWDNAPTKTFEDGLLVSPKDKLAVTCEWGNTGDTTLRYPHEMCFAIGYYWPADTGFTCVSGGGGPEDQCTCFARGHLDAGPGGNVVELTLRRAESIPGAGGPLDQTDGKYCFLYRAEDVTAEGLKPDARPYYFRDAQDIALLTSKDTAAIVFDDVSAGQYVGTCMMDVVGGGFVPGSGDVLNSAPVILNVENGKTTKADVLLDVAIP